MNSLKRLKQALIGGATCLISAVLLAAAPAAAAPDNKLDSA